MFTYSLSCSILISACYLKLSFIYIYIYNSFFQRKYFCTSRFRFARENLLFLSVMCRSNRHCVQCVSLCVQISSFLLFLSLPIFQPSPLSFLSSLDTSFSLYHADFLVRLGMLQFLSLFENCFFQNPCSTRRVRLLRIRMEKVNYPGCVSLLSYTLQIC